MLQRYYGWYTNRTRGIRRRTATHGQASASAVEVEPVPPSLQEARRRWAELLRRIFEVDPLRCPRCGHEMRIVAFITQPRMIAVQCPVGEVRDNPTWRAFFEADGVAAYEQAILPNRARSFGMIDLCSCYRAGGTWR